ncbi:MAG: energy transducer TonB [Saprospiraceae bacterium]|nr:energy transducer TonB [Saprospiraceae bacterium]
MVYALHVILVFLIVGTTPTPEGRQKQICTNSQVLLSSGDTLSKEPRYFHKDCEKITEETEKGKCANQKMYMEFYRELRYPALARENGIQGTVEVSLTISKEGYIKDVRLIKDIGGGCGKEVVSYFQKMKDQHVLWIPAFQDGLAVESEKIIPVNFRLD